VVLGLMRQAVLSQVITAGLRRQGEAGHPVRCTRWQQVPKAAAAFAGTWRRRLVEYKLMRQAVLPRVISGV
jgi:hypothetical protein